MRRVKTFIAAAAVATTAVLVPALPASASTSECFAGEVCVWENANYSGGFAAWTGSIINLSGKTFDNGHSLNDSISSLWNRTNVYVYFYPDKNWGGGYDLAQSPGGYRENLAVDSKKDGLKYNDTFSSALFGS